MKERREVRSSALGTSLRLWLDAVARRHGIRELVVADATGFLVEGTIEGTAAEEAAAIAAARARPDAPGGITITDAGVTMVIHSLSCGGELLHIAAKGRQDPARESVIEAASGVERILGA